MEEVVVNKFNYSGFWKRVAANFIDSVILQVTFYTILALFYFIMIMICIGNKDFVAYVLQVENIEVILFSIFFIFFGTLKWLYYALFECSSIQATIGKRALRIKVTDVNGSRISFKKATARYFSKIISAIIMLGGFIMVAFTEKKQGLHDQIANTLVINE